jgi:iron complex outermembrane receptor protein
VYGSDGYQAREAQVGGLHNAPLLDTPAAVSVFSRQLLDDRQVRKLSEVLQSDASVGESYAPVGYYENFNVRGFELNAASSYRINGQTIAGEQNVALENKQQVELLKGLSGLQSGVSEPGGLINYVTKRTQDVRTSAFPPTNRANATWPPTWAAGSAASASSACAPTWPMKTSAATSTTPTASATSPRWPPTGRSTPTPCCSWTPNTSTASSTRCRATNCWAAAKCRTMSTQGPPGLAAVGQAGAERLAEPGRALRVPLQR